jgi:hypothetical protein
MNGFLENLIGDWELSGMMGETPLRQTVQANWVLGGLFVEMNFKSLLAVSPGKTPYEAIYWVGHNAEHDVYVLHLIDTFGVATDCIVGIGKLENNAIPFVFNYSDGPFTNKFIWDVSTGAWEFKQSYVENHVTHVFAHKRMTRVSQSASPR